MTTNVIKFPLLHTPQPIPNGATLDTFRTIRRLFNSLDIEDQDLALAVFLPDKAVIKEACDAVRKIRYGR